MPTPAKSPPAKTVLARARACIRLEMDALAATADSLDENFAAAVRAGRNAPPLAES